MAGFDNGSGPWVPLSREQKRNQFHHDPANPQKTWRRLHDDMISIGDSYFNHGFGKARLRESLRDFWDELIHAAKITPADSPELDRLVTLILEARELGHFARRPGSMTSNMANLGRMDNEERLWCDLPYLAREFQDAWGNESASYSATERESLAALTAKLVAVGVCSDQLSGCALWFLKETLETERPLRGPNSQDHPEQTNSEPSVVDLLPACDAWFQHGRFKLAQRSLVNFNPDVSMWSNENIQMSSLPGGLALEAGVTQPGFSVKRWLFWRQRLKDFYDSGDAQIAGLARACFEEIVMAGMKVGLEIPGEREYLRNLFKALREELTARGPKGCVWPEEIEIDMGWAEENKSTN
ncbi:hypothetical protein LOZ53_000633 [Ophidiomyces ophidiicola]|nr:hypothetical protein LOZ55_001281 [Ophidiomyces ophidiicola]KAI1984612.1 hypothetical protein LOZ54_004488 [Ophidiomyces ophidiicola]KAI1997453.1 hypothetical protein LOZ53_000633 [Ophidiomyces ophidiicola]KAI1999433.1 hypothetical protein LOZ51_001920 [Ophidiomyces ophidiicola]KAI2093251.1 hypothetical protein LOZ36_000126 [Ophidiomyces ophidiicola]